MIEAVVFDLDGVLLDTEQVWDEVRSRYVRERGGRYDAQVQRAMMGMSAPEWSRFLVEEAGVPGPPQRVSDEVVELMAARYHERLPLLEGAAEAVERLAARWPLGLASSSNRPLIEAALELSGLGRFFRATVSSEEVARGKPAPDVYLEAARLLGFSAERCAAVEDSDSGMRSARAAGLLVVAVPNPHYPPGHDALALADVVLGSIAELTPAALEP